MLMSETYCKSTIFGIKIREYLENYTHRIHKSFDRFLMLLKTKGPQTAHVIAKELGITGEGARFQLSKLAEEGLVKAVSETKGVGRPIQIWSLTEKGNKQFPDFHADLSMQLLESVKETLGAAALEVVLKNRESKANEKYFNELKDITDLEQKIIKLVQIRTGEGYLAEWEKDEEGYLLKENHCPICAAATKCQDLCGSELSTFQQVLGEGVVVSRVNHILAGASHCAYRITQAPNP